MEIRSIKFFSVKSYGTNIELLCVFSFTQMSQKFYDQCLAPSYIMVVHMMIFFNFLEDLIDIFHIRPIKTKCIFDIKISISKPIRYFYLVKASSP